MATIKQIELIVTDPKVRSGRPVVAGTSLEISVIAIARVVHEQNPEEIAEDFGLTLSQVYAALSYYYSHKVEIDASIRERQELAGALKEKRIGSRHQPLFG